MCHVTQLPVCAQERALKAFHLDSEKWGVNVQPLSGSPANFHVSACMGVLLSAS